ncbi:MAG: nitrous oxide reductase accessory protein NosL [Gemmatimonadota bacterium]|nr:nitrous oxide reductase accessory protein NosL [Gemmatimonadota bacterium]
MAGGDRAQASRMARGSRILILVASIALGLTYILPIWTISLEAPQYPEGLGMVIRLNTIEGQKKHDLSNINNLNHYIGMKRIEPESIPELRIMPVVVGMLILTGLLVAGLGRKRLLYAWTAVFLAISLVGLADFWKWEYDYGHDLDEETAIIKIPGMSYQPPLIGSREILNFTAHSWPGTGGAIAILVALTAVGVSFREWRSGGGRDRRAEGGVGAASSKKLVGVGSLGLVMMFGLAGCGDSGPRPLVAGVDACADCLMVLDSNGHGGQIVSAKGRIYTFDSVECMANHLRMAMEDEGVRSLWVVDFSEPQSLVVAEEAFYLVSPTLASPMGLGVTAFARLEDRDGAVHAFGGDAEDWSGIQALVSSAWPDGRPSGSHGGHATEVSVPGEA